MVLKWYDSNKRTLPWRENSNPYEIWISEVLVMGVNNDDSNVVLLEPGNQIENGTKVN